MLTLGNYVIYLKTRSSPERAFPDFSDAPAFIKEGAFANRIPLSVPVDFFLPEVDSRGWPMKEIAVVAMPKTAMHEQRAEELRKYHIRSSWHAINMQSVPVASTVKVLANAEFRFCVLAFYG